MADALQGEDFGVCVLGQGNPDVILTCLLCAAAECSDAVRSQAACSCHGRHRARVQFRGICEAALYPPDERGKRSTAVEASKGNRCGSIVLSYCLQRRRGTHILMIKNPRQA